MDTQLLTDDLSTSLGLLPPEVVTLLARVAQAIVGKYREQLETAWPQILELLKPHVSVALFEYSTGLLNSEELEVTVMRVVQSYARRLEVADHGAKAG